MKPTQSFWELFQFYYPSVKPEFQLNLGEGQTPITKIDNIYFKREDTNPTGSVKDRGIAFQVSALRQQGNSKFVISSSGNAAISAAHYCQLGQLDLTIFVSPKLSLSKIKVLKQFSFQIISDPRPISSAFRYAQANNYYNLRPAKGSLGATGYQSIAYELFSQLPPNYYYVDLTGF